MLTGSAAGTGTLSDAAMRSFARTLPALGGDDRFVAAMTAAWRNISLQARGFTIATSKDGMRIAFTAPASVTGNGGAKLTLSPQTGGPLLASGADGMNGALTADLSGRDLPAVHLVLTSYRANAESWAATASFDATLDYRDMRGLAIAGAGDLSADATRLSFTPTRCADVKLATLLANGAPFVSAGAARLCADPNKALFASDASGWRFGGRWDGATAVLDSLQSAMSAGDGRVDLSGNASGLTSGTFEIAHSAVDDRLPAARFLQIAVSGRGTMTAKDANATLALSAHDRAFASVAVKQSLTDGSGSASIDATSLDFAASQFQPGDISPMLAMLGTRVTGKAAFTGQLAWKNGAIDSSGHLTANNVDFQSPLGQVRQANTDIAFSSLIPFAAGSGQTFSASRIDSLVPIETVATTFSFTQQAVRIESASAKLAGGTASVEPMTYVFAPDATTLGTLKLENIDLAPLLMAAGLASRVEANAHLNGSIPFSSGPEGLRFSNGTIAANAPGRLSIKREALVASAGVGAGGAAPPNAVQDFAYQALENLAFDRLEGTVNSRPMGRLGVLFHIVGSNDPPQAAEARVGLFDLIQGSAFDKPIPLPKGTPIDLTLDTSINLDELLAAYRASSSP
jgi:hypothetical protein